MNTKAIPPINALLAKIPSGREINTIPVYQPPMLDQNILDTMRSSTEDRDDYENAMSSDDDDNLSHSISPLPAPGAYPGTISDHVRSSTASSNTYY